MSTAFVAIANSRASQPLVAHISIHPHVSLEYLQANFYQKLYAVQEGTLLYYWWLAS